MSIRQSLCALIAALLLFGAPARAEQPAASESTALRVAYWERGARYEALPDGGLTGYDATLLGKVAAIGGFELIYVPVLSPAEAIRAVDEGRADIISTMMKTPEREAEYLYGSLSTGLVFMGLIAPASRGDLVYRDAEAIGRCAIAYETNSGVTEDCVSHLRAFYPGATLTPYSSVTEMREAIQRGEIDAMATGANNLKSDEKLLDLFSPREVYYMTTRQNAALMARVDAALFDLIAGAPSYLNDLQREFFPMYFAKEFSREQLTYAAACEPLTVGVPPDRKPICWYDEQSGAFQGVMIDLLNGVAQRAGLTFLYQPNDCATEREALERFDLVAPTMAQTQAGDRLVSASFLHSSANLGVLDDRTLRADGAVRLGLTRDASSLENLMRDSYYPEAMYSVYDTQEQALRALQNGEIDAAVNTSLVWYYLRQNPAMRNVSLLPDLAVRVDYCIAADKRHGDKRLMDVLNVAIGQQGESERSGAIARHTTAALYVRTFADELRDYWLVYALGLAVILSLLALIVQRSRHYREVARKSAETQESLKTKSMFFSQVSHDLRTPMNAVLGFTRLARDEPNLSPTVKDYLDKILASGDYLLSLVNNVLDVTKIENARLELVDEPVDAPRFIRDMAQTYQKEAAALGITLQTSFQPLEHPWLYMDMLRTRQIYFNLLGNAVKYSAPGTTVEWRIAYAAESAASVTVLSTIRDHGCGMSEEFLSRLFTPFEQERNVFSGRQSSSGLGLAIVKHLVNLMGGTIDVESKLGEGTTFTLRFTRLVAPPPQDASPKEESVAVADLSGKRVLLCEDQSLNQQIAQLLLEKKGMSVDCAANGMLGLNAFRDSRVGYYDAILMDVRMPVMDGLDATRLIRAERRPDARAIPIIAMTANAFSEDVSATAAAGMDAHLTKPIDPQAMYDTLARLMR